ncbi:MAG: PIN domain nuclease [Dehalococcoidales bacterium]|nr:PIN domain nuclease [Dehalococcoidales bacterium]
MILVDSSVWIDYFNGRKTARTDLLDLALGNTPVVTGDLILVEVLQGFRDDSDFQTARDLLASLIFMPVLGRQVAEESAINYRFLRKKGVTVKKTIDVIIGTFCLHHDIHLLTGDRDFDPMVKYLKFRLVDL